MGFPERKPAARMITVLVAVLAGLVWAPAAFAVTFGQLDDFQDGGKAGWDEGFQSPNRPTNVPDGGPAGAGDRFLRNVSAGFSAGSRQVMFNRAQWTGSYGAAGVTRIDAHVINLGATPLHLRVALQGPGGTTFGSTNAVELEPAEQTPVWRPVTFHLTSDALSRVEGAQSLAAVLGGVTELRILSAEGGPAREGDDFDATLGVDNLRALTLPGDANLDGAVNGSDFALLAGNFGRTGRTWNTGDFNFDDSVNGTDFALLAGNFGRTVPSSGALSVTDADWAALEAFGAGIGASPVPEPAAGCLLALAPLLARRSRRPAAPRP